MMLKKFCAISTILCLFLNSSSLFAQAIDDAEQEELDTLLEEVDGNSPEGTTLDSEELDFPDSGEKLDATEDLFLPVPSDSSNTPPSGRYRNEPSSSFFEAANTRQNDLNNNGLDLKPKYTLYGGYAEKAFTSNFILNPSRGYMLGFDFRIFQFSLFNRPLNGKASANFAFLTVEDSNFNTGVNVSPITEKIFHLGGVLEYELFRSIQIFAGLYFYKNKLTLGNINDESVKFTITNRASALNETKVTAGAGANWDFYIIPHGRLGLKGYFEPDFVYFALAVSFEPKPRKKQSKNHGWIQ